MTARRLHLARQRGLSLIEIMIGCVIGVIGVLVMFQTVTIGSRHAQSTSIGGDADVAGTLALFNIERDLRLGGLGFGSADPAIMGCTVNATDAAAPPRPNFTFAFNPIVINSGAGGAPDTIDVLYGNSSFATLGQRVISTSPSGTSNFLRRREGFKNGDLVVVAGPGGCYLQEITGSANLDGFTVDHDSVGNYTSAYAPGLATPRFNPTTAYPAVAGATMFSLGNAPRRHQWAIGTNGRLQRTDLIFNTAPFDVADGILNMKAEYGVDANGDGSIQATEWTFTPPVAWDTVLGIRIAVLVRIGAFERSPDAGATALSPVTPTNPQWGNGDSDHQFLMTDVNGTTDTNPTASNTVANNWRYYRYRVYEKTVPLRNVIW